MKPFLANLLERAFEQTRKNRGNVFRGAWLMLTVLVSGIWMDWVPLAQAQMMPARPIELDPKWGGIYSQYHSWLFTYKVIDQERTKHGYPSLVEDAKLAYAALTLAQQMIRQDWAGLDLPNGLNVQKAVAQQGYPTYGVVVGLFRASWPKSGNLNNDGPFSYYPEHVIRQLSSLNGLNPNIKSFAYASAMAENDRGRVRKIAYEVILFGNLAPEDYGNTSYRPVITKPVIPSNKTALLKYKVRRRKLAKITLTAQPSRRYLKGKAKIKGNLPPGLKFNTRKACFDGRPQKKGRYRLKVTARYKRRGGDSQPGTDGGKVTLPVIIKVR